MTSVYIALGSNIDPRQEYLEKAVDRLSTLGAVTHIAPLYESEPYGERDQPPFLNTALILKTDLQPLALLDELKNIESVLGRKKRYRWGPREIDLDIIFYGQKIVRKTDLVIPHPDYKNRRFVLQPLVDINPDFKPPDASQTLSQILQDCSDRSHLIHLTKKWIADGTQF